MKAKVLICCGNACKRNFSDYILERAENERERAEKASLISPGDIVVECTGCMGKCKKGPNVKVELNGSVTEYEGMTSLKMGAVMKEVLRKIS